MLWWDVSESVSEFDVSSVIVSLHKLINALGYQLFREVIWSGSYGSWVISWRSSGMGVQFISAALAWSMRHARMRLVFV